MSKLDINKLCENREKKSYTLKQIKKFSKKIPINNKRYRKTWINSICSHNNKSKKQNNRIDCSLTTHNGFSSKNNKNKINKLCIYEDNKIDFSKCKYKIGRAHV